MAHWRLSVLALAFGMFALPGSAQAKCMVGDVADLKVTMVNEQPLIDVTVNGHPTRFMVDSGAFYSIIPTGSARELGLSLTPLYNFHVHGVGGEQDASLATVKDLTLANLALHNIKFIVAGSEIGTNAGVIGQNVLGYADVEYDLEHGVIRLMKPKDCGGIGFAYWAGSQPVSIIETETRDTNNPHTIGKIYINGAPIRAVFDTGAGTSILSLSAAARAGIHTDSPGVIASGYSHGAGRRLVKTWIAPFDSVKIGGEELHHPKLQIGDIGLNDADMLIGADFFISHRVYVANSQRKMYFTYDGGPVFNLHPVRAVDDKGAVIALPALQSTDPKDAAGYSERGMVFAARHELGQAEADLTKAIELAPNEGHYYYQRATIRLAARHPMNAHDDLDTALKLSPNDAEAHITRARLRLVAHDRPAALEDIEAADHALAPASNARLDLGSLYEGVDMFDQAITQFDSWIRAHPDDSRRPVALNGRCWSRALAGRDLPAALSDCNTAVRAQRDSANYLDSRGLVHLRMGDFADAISDYTASLAINPKSAWSLYGRALAERHLKQPSADADQAAALAIAPHLDERFRTLGIS